MKPNNTPLAAAAAIGACLSFLTACASSPVPYEKIAVAKASVQRAEQNGAPEFAPVELSTARDKLNRAEQAAAKHDSTPASDLAEQANIDAELAEATAAEKRAHKAAMESQANLQALREESVRGTQPGVAASQPVGSQP